MEGQGTGSGEGQGKAVGLGFCTIIMIRVDQCDAIENDYSTRVRRRVPSFSLLLVKGVDDGCMYVVGKDLDPVRCPGHTRQTPRPWTGRSNHSQ